MSLRERRDGYSSLFTAGQMHPPAEEELWDGRVHHTLEFSFSLFRHDKTGSVLDNAEAFIILREMPLILDKLDCFCARAWRREHFIAEIISYWTTGWLQSCPFKIINCFGNFFHTYKKIHQFGNTFQSNMLIIFEELFLYESITFRDSYRWKLNEFIASLWDINT